MGRPVRSATGRILLIGVGILLLVTVATWPVRLESRCEHGSDYSVCLVTHPSVLGIPMPFGGPLGVGIAIGLGLASALLLLGMTSALRSTKRT